MPGGAWVYYSAARYGAERHAPAARQGADPQRLSFLAYHPRDLALGWLGPSDERARAAGELVRRKPRTWSLLEIANGHALELSNGISLFASSDVSSFAPNAEVLPGPQRAVELGEEVHDAVVEAAGGA